MGKLTQFNLRELFLLLFCFCIGLTGSCSVGPYRLNWEESLEALPWIVYESLLNTGATTMFIGLIQPVTLLRQIGRDEQLSYQAPGFAVSWLRNSNPACGINCAESRARTRIVQAIQSRERILFILLSPDSRPSPVWLHDRCAHR